MSGSFNWELTVIERRQLDVKHGFLLEKVPYADLSAEKIALQGGHVDLIVHPWLWVAAQRMRGVPVQAVYPYTLNLAALLVPQDSPIRGLDDLHGKRIGIFSPVNSNWLILRAACQRLHGFDPLADNTAITGSPVLLSGLLEQGEFDAILQFWQHSVHLLAGGPYRAVVEVSDLLRVFGVSKPVAFAMYVCREEFVEDHPELVRAYLDAAREAHEHLTSSDAIWPELGQQIGISDARIMSMLRRRYVDGLPEAWDAESVQDVHRLFEELEKAGCTDILGYSSVPPGTFSMAFFR